MLNFIGHLHTHAGLSYRAALQDLKTPASSDIDQVSFPFLPDPQLRRCGLWQWHVKRLVLHAAGSFGDKMQGVCENVRQMIVLYDSGDASCPAYSRVTFASV